MSVVVVGMSYRSAPIRIREELAIVPARLEEALTSIGEYVAESVILSTCNRVEVYASTKDADLGLQRVSEFLVAFSGASRHRVEPHLYRYSDVDAVRHLFRVTCGLDSMVLGESEILGQVRDAMVAANQAGRLNVTLTKLFHRGLRTGRAARSETAIGRHSLSVSTAGVERARTILGSLQDCRVLIVSAGEAGKLTAKGLRDAGASEIAVTNRTESRAVALAAELGGHVVDFSNLKGELSSYDVVISATAAEGYVIDADAIRAAVHGRDERPMCLIDIAVPRDIDPRCRDIENVFLYDIDDLKAVTEKNRTVREREIESVEAIIESEVQGYADWARTRGASDVVAQIQGKAEAIRQRELARSMRKLGHLAEEDRERINALTRALTRKLLHDTSSVLKGRGEDDAVLETARVLFQVSAD